jgi:hypothetical protein
MRSVRLPARLIGAVSAVVIAAGALLMTGASALVAAAPADQTAANSACHLDSPTGKVRHVVELTFDNVHFSRDNPNVPSDLEQMPNLLNFVTHNGTLLSNMHTPLIAHTADDIITTLTGVYGDKHGQPVANSYRVYNSDGSTSSASSFAYWTDPVAAGHTTDTTPTMVTPAGGIAPAPWVPFTRAGCDVGAISTANIEIENVATDVPTIFGPNSTQEAEVAAQTKQYGYPDIATADYEGIAVHCANTTTSACAGNPNAVTDALPTEPGGYQGFKGLFGNKYVAPRIGGTQTATGVRVDDLFGQPLTNDYAGSDVHGTYYGFPGFSVTAAQTLGYVADMQEHGIPVTYGYISDAHENFGPGDPRYEANLKADDTAFGDFFANLAAHGINQTNTLFVISSDEGDHLAGVQQQGCDGVHTPCTYAAGQVGEVNANLNGLLAAQAWDKGADYTIHADSAPQVYVTGQPAATSDRVRQLEHEINAITAPDPYANSDQGGTVPIASAFADQTEQGILHMNTGDPKRNPSFTVFGNPDYFVNPGPTTCTGPSGQQTGTGNPCVVIDPSYNWNHGDVAPEINTNWAAFAGPGVAAQGVDQRTWADETDVRPTLLTLIGLHDDYPSDGRVLVEDLTRRAVPPALRSNADTVRQLAQVYKQLNADVGSFGLNTIAVSTAAVRTTDPVAYAALENELAQLGSDRDAVAGQIAGLLNGAAFGNRPISQWQAQWLIWRGNDIIDQAHQLARQSTH